ncbi:MAG TPA: tRNA-(ms[2]io[6]A)-hydroxylase [Sandaracinaceae bacterium LLY-WYZ-13_1]|nr:tRNA-(ms[2]io[6]A)-hydroxylase [Sandaracinaceae bacterium LLY-WYZ-13_1]
MLGLLTPTDPSWVDAVEGNLDRLLSDHAHCELKAAQSALSMVARFAGEAPEIVAPLVALAKEETGHFDQVHRRLASRDAELDLPEADGYVVALRRAIRRDHGAYPLMLDRLLNHALIEGRSCERFRLLSERLADADLRAFYRALMESEARHFVLFTRLAEDRFGRETTRARLATLAEREAEVIAGLPLGPTVHG